MKNTNDQRQQPGSVVNTRVTLVTPEAECKRLFGSLWKGKRINGTVVSVQIDTSTGRRQTSVTVDWSIQDRTTRVSLKLVNIKPGEASGDVSSTANENAPSSAPIELPDRQPSEEEPQDAHDMAGVGRVCKEVHGKIWTNKEVSLPLDGSISPRLWKVIGSAGETHIQGHSEYDKTPYDFFLCMFPIEHLSKITELTNRKLANGGHMHTTAGEILKFFFGILILLCRFEFTSRRSLWSTQSTSKYIPLAMFGKIMSRNRFESLVSCITFRSHSESDTNDRRWSLVSGSVDAIKRHRRSFVSPSESICVDKSMSRWYGLGGDWMTKGLPHYVAIDCKPENGCEIKTACCGVSGIVLNLEIVLSASDIANLRYETNFPHGTSIVLRLTEPWFHSNRLVCADSAFASVATANVLYEYGLRFTGVFKNSTRQFPTSYLSGVELFRRGNHVSMISQRTDNSPSMMAVLWIDRDRRYFVSTSGTTLPSTLISRSRWRYNGTVLVQLEIPIPQVVSTYYEICSQIDRHNRCKQDDLGLEEKFEVNDWSLRVNTSLLAICIVDSWLLYKGLMGARNCMSQKDFYAKLAEQLIENSFDAICLRRSDVDVAAPSNPSLACGTGIHLVPTLKRRKLANGTPSKAAFQSRCKICKSDKKSKYLCSECMKMNKEIWICHSETGRDCFQKHLHDVHFCEN